MLVVEFGKIMEEWQAIIDLESQVSKKRGRQCAPATPRDSGENPSTPEICHASG